MINFRTANPADASEINEVTRKAFKLYADEVGANINVKALHETEQSVLDDIAAHKVFVAEDESGKILGSVRIKSLSGELAYLYRFGVKPSVRNGGVGSGLLQAAIDYCAERGFTAIALHTNAKYYNLARYYYGKRFYVHSTSTEKGYIRALFVKELQNKNFDISPAYKE